MIYKLKQTNGIFDSLEPTPFQSIPREKHLENLLAKNLLDVLFEDNELMPILQERPQQEEADIYALNQKGDLFIFELKRDNAGEGAVHQALRYCEKAAHWGYERLETLLSRYVKRQVNLQNEHATSFNLEHELEKSAFNTRQHLVVVGSAGDEDLIRNVDYWKSKGLLINFIPYRIYKIGGEHYFEFFSPPYDRHANPADKKGVLFDTCKTYQPQSIWYMCDNDRVAAFGHIKDIVRSLSKGDTIFLYHKGEGIIAAGEVKGEVKLDSKADALYRDLKWLTAKPKRGVRYKFMPPADIKRVTERNFWWAKTMKAPYLKKEESETLLAALRATLG